MHTTAKSYIAEQVSRRVEADGLSTKDIASRLGVSESQAWRLIRGRCGFSMTQLRVLANVLGARVSDFLPPQGEPEWLTADEAAARAHRHPETVRRAIRAGELPAIQRCKSGKWLLKSTDVDDWLAGVRR